MSRSVSPVNAVPSESLSIRTNSVPQPTSPSPSVASEKNEIDLQAIKLLIIFIEYFFTYILINKFLFISGQTRAAGRGKKTPYSAVCFHITLYSIPF